MTVYSSKDELKKIAHYLIAYMKIPYFQDDTIPGKIMEKIIAMVRGAEQLSTYDFVDVVKTGKVGWQVKSTKSSTPLTWKRAKIANRNTLILNSEILDAEKSLAGCKSLGDAIIDFCNAHAKESFDKFQLDEIGMCRLIIFEDNIAIYYEKQLCTKTQPEIFQKDDYIWKWSIQKEVVKKEQLTALHGTNIKTKKKAFAWHGRGENQLHFSGEGSWWPDIEKPTKVGEINFSSDGHAIAFKLSTDKVGWDELTEFLIKPS